MGRLDEVDLSQSLTRREETVGLERAWERLSQLRLTLGGQIGEREIVATASTRPLIGS